MRKPCGAMGGSRGPGMTAKGLGVAWELGRASGGHL